MHPDADAFLDAIFAIPHDDLPRLVYADWLEEHGQSNYARFIRLQCAAAHETPFSPAANELWEQIGRVWNGMRDVFWLTDGLDWTQQGASHPESIDATWFHRGFLRPKVAVGVELLARYGPLWWPWFPTPICRLAPDDYWEPQAAKIRTLSRIRRLILAGGMGEMGVVLLASPYLGRLESLDLSERLVYDGDFDVLFGPDRLPNVRELSIRVFDREADGRMKGRPPANDLTRQGIRARLEGRFKQVKIEWTL